MPTGYTAGVQNGTVTDFKDFALTCSRAFGALVMMREEPLSAEIPDQLQPDTRYYDKRIADVKKRLCEITVMSEEQWEEAAQLEHQEDKERQAAREETRKLEEARYKAMLVKVKKWEPPTPEHVEMKSFMIKQLNDSIEFDTKFHTGWGIKLKSGQEWFNDQKKSLEEALARATTDRQAEIDRTIARNKWINALRESLKDA